MIIDTDIGGDPDDAVALAIAARTIPELALVVTSDEVSGERARFARHLLDLAGRAAVPVVAGRQVGDGAQYCVAGMTPQQIGAQPTDVAAAVAAAVEMADGPVRWVGLGPLSNLADLLGARPDQAGRLAVTQMGGALRYRNPARAEHNVRRDPAALHAVLGAMPRVWLVTSEITFTSEIEVTADSALYQALAGPDAPGWAHLLALHLDRWFADFHPGSMQHDALTLSAAAQLPFVDFELTPIAVDPAGRMSPGGDAGARLFVSRRAHYEPFNRWLTRSLGAWEASRA
jgi:inosine-uridine nucleoside N-ribohydrolase